MALKILKALIVPEAGEEVESFTLISLQINPAVFRVEKVASSTPSYQVGNWAALVDEHHLLTNEKP